MSDAYSVALGNWRKGSYSNSAGAACVEANCGVGLFFVRDSKDRRADRPVITVCPHGWRALLNALSVHM